MVVPPFPAAPQSQAGRAYSASRVRRAGGSPPPQGVYIRPAVPDVRLGRRRAGTGGAPATRRVTPHTARNANPSRQAIGYVRVSTEQQADSGLSIAAQRVKLEALAVLNDYQLIDVVVDAGASAKSLDRPGWQRVMGAVHGRQVGAVLIAKLDRCTRSVADLASLIDTFSRRGVALISAAESLDTSSAGGRLVVNVTGRLREVARPARDTSGGT